MIKQNQLSLPKHISRVVCLFLLMFVLYYCFIALAWGKLDIKCLNIADGVHYNPWDVMNVIA